MKKYSQIFLLSAASLILTFGITAAKIAAQETDVRVTIKEAGMGTGVENRTLTGAGDTFEEGARIYFFTWIMGSREGDYVSHVWIHEEEEKFRIDLNTGGPSWRTWSYKTMHPGSTGDWRVQVEDKDGKVLDSMRFKCISWTSE